MNIIIGNAWPYANGPLHLGRIAVLLPGDILARWGMRLFFFQELIAMVHL